MVSLGSRDLKPAGNDLSGCTVFYSVLASDISPVDRSMLPEHQGSWREGAFLVARVMLVAPLRPQVNLNFPSKMCSENPSLPGWVHESAHHWAHLPIVWGRVGDCSGKRGDGVRPKSVMVGWAFARLCWPQNRFGNEVRKRGLGPLGSSFGDAGEKAALDSVVR